MLSLQYLEVEPQHYFEILSYILFLGLNLTIVQETGPWLLKILCAITNNILALIIIKKFTHNSNLEGAQKAELQAKA